MLGHKGGLSSGVALVIDKVHDTEAPEEGQDGENSPDMEEKQYEIVPGRAVAVIITGWGGTRLLIVNLYLDVNDGLQELSLGILYAVGEWIARIGIPYVICGDFSSSPKEISALRWLDSIDGEVIAPDEATHWSSRQTEGTIID